jgi:hypothetical protein
MFLPLNIISQVTPMIAGYRLSARADSNLTLFYRLHGGDNVQVKRYFVSFWNGVDLRYKLLKGPKIRISIAGIIISRVCMTSTEMAVRGDNNCLLTNSTEQSSSSASQEVPEFYAA